MADQPATLIRTSTKPQRSSGETLAVAGVGLAGIAGVAAYLLLSRNNQGTTPPPTTPSALTINTPILSAGVVGSAYTDVTLSASGGTAPYSWEVVQSQLPPGLALSPEGLISGTPTTAGSYAVGIQCTDSSSPTPQVAIVNVSLMVTQESTCTLSAGIVYNVPGTTLGQYILLNGALSGFDSPEAETQYGAENWPHVGISLAQFTACPLGPELSVVGSGGPGSLAPITDGRGRFAVVDERGLAHQIMNPVKARGLGLLDGVQRVSPATFAMIPRGVPLT